MDSEKEKKTQDKMKKESKDSELPRKNLHYANSNSSRIAGSVKEISRNKQRVKDAKK